MWANKSQISLSLSIACFVLLTRDAFLLKFLEPRGYVIDVYSIFPYSFYLGLIFCYLVASFFVLSGKNSIGLLILSINHLELLLIPYMLGYYSMGRGDDMSYIGEYSQIASSGHFASWNIYPVSHIIGGSISVISSLEVNVVSFIIPMIFSFLFIVGTYLYSRKLFPNSHIKSLTILSSFILYLGVYNFLNVPHALFFAFMPLYLFVMHSYFDNGRHVMFPFSVVFILMTLIIPYTHPFIVFFLVIIFLFHLIFKIPYISWLEIVKAPPVSLGSFLVLIISFFSWFVYNDALMSSFRTSYLSYINKVTEPVFIKTSSQLAKVHFDLLDYIELFGFFYGRYLGPTLFIVASFVFFYYNKNLLNKKTFENYLYLVVLYVVLLFQQVILLLNPIISHQPDRIMNLNFVVYAQISLFAISLYVLFLQRSKSVYRICLVCLILASIWTLSLFGCFDSPRVSRANVALTYNEVEGMSWFYNLKDNSAAVCVPLSQINRFHDLFGETSTYDSVRSFPDHFGYSNNSAKFKEINLENGLQFYVVLLTIDELLYQDVPSFAKVGRYCKSDFIRLRTDKSINKIYDSMNIEIFISSLN